MNVTVSRPRLATALAAVTLARFASARAPSVGIGSALHGQLVDDGR